MQQPLPMGEMHSADFVQTFEATSTGCYVLEGAQLLCTSVLAKLLLCMWVWLPPGQAQVLWTSLHGPCSQSPVRSLGLTASVANYLLFAPT